MPDTSTDATVEFAPRRIGHANIFVGDLERSLAFYGRVCGIQEVRREPGIGAGFLSNGNTHHDVGLMQCGGGQRVGVGGHVQIPDGRGRSPGLNHIGWEMDNEAALVAAYRRGVAAGLKTHRTSDHQLAHSVYLFDPDGNLHEFYADVVDDWRKVFNPDREDLITGHWDPLATAPMTTRYWRAKPEICAVAGAVFNPMRISRGVLVARNFDRMKAFFTGIGGLRPVPVKGADGVVLLRGAATEKDFDLALFAHRDGLEPGMHHFTFDMVDEQSLAAAEQKARTAGIEIEIIADRPHKRSVFVRDPDGLRIEFSGRRRDGFEGLAGVALGLQPYLV